MIAPLVHVVADPAASEAAVDRCRAGHVVEQPTTTPTRRRVRNSTPGRSLACHVRSATICRSWHLSYCVGLCAHQIPCRYTWSESIWRQTVCDLGQRLSPSDCRPIERIRYPSDLLLAFSQNSYVSRQLCRDLSLTVWSKPHL